MKLQLFRYETFRRHARAFIEPAVIHRWKVTQSHTGCESAAAKSGGKGDTWW